MRKMNLALQMPSYQQSVAPHGWLNSDPACRALFHYAVTARKNYETQRDTIQYEGEADPSYNYEQLCSSIATAYGTTPERMVHFWKNIDMQFRTLRLPLVPSHLRFDSTPDIVTDRKTH
jgi:hypothetical protein